MTGGTDDEQVSQTLIEVENTSNTMPDNFSELFASSFNFGFEYDQPEVLGIARVESHVLKLGGHAAFVAVSDYVSCRFTHCGLVPPRCEEVVLIERFYGALNAVIIRPPGV